jgi:2-oxoisovalerate dehydrogenase E1 component beta subunit
LETAMTTTTMTMIQALRSAMDVMLERDDDVVVFGQDVGYFGGVFRCTEGLQSKYGTSRVFDAPISESGIVGVAVGMGAYGLRPVAEIQFADYVYPATDQIISEAARLRYRSAGQFTAPLTLRMPCGGGIYGGQTHSQSIEAVFTQVCGLRTVMPSNPYDAKGLLIASIENDDPVIFLEHKHLYRQTYNKSAYPGPDFMIPFGKAKVVRQGADLTVVSYGAVVQRSLTAAKELAETDGLDVEVIDLRSLSPVDFATVAESVRKTNRVIVAHEDALSWGYGAEIAARIADEVAVQCTTPDAAEGMSAFLEKRKAGWTS